MAVALPPFVEPARALHRRGGVFDGALRVVVTTKPPHGPPLQRSSMTARCVCLLALSLVLLHKEHCCLGSPVRCLMVWSSTPIKLTRPASILLSWPPASPPRSIGQRGAGRRGPGVSALEAPAAAAAGLAPRLSVARRARHARATDFGDLPLGPGHTLLIGDFGIGFPSAIVSLGTTA